MALILNGVSLSGGISAGQAGDPYFPYVRLLLNGEGTLSGNNLLGADQSLYGAAVTRVNAATVQTGDGPYGVTVPNTRLYGGTTGTTSATHAINIASGEIPAIGTGNFTLEGWYYKTESNATDISMGIITHTGPSSWLQMTLSSSGVPTGFSGTTIGRLVIRAGTTTAIPIGITGQLAINTWHYIAMSRVSGVTYGFHNGTLLGSAADTTNYPAATFRLFNIGAGDRNLPGYMDDVRITVGVGRYTSSFTAPTSPFETF